MGAQRLGLPKGKSKAVAAGAQSMGWWGGQG